MHLEVYWFLLNFPVYLNTSFQCISTQSSGFCCINCDISIFILILLIWVFSFVFLVILAKVSSILFIFPKNQLFFFLGSKFIKQVLSSDLVDSQPKAESWEKRGLQCTPVRVGYISGVYRLYHTWPHTILLSILISGVRWPFSGLTSGDIPKIWGTNFLFHWFFV
jgi:hypothetical protein